ncbi:mucin-associated surface protein (MASP) [Trypanosoma cruzi]|nr:mucin-associated surface protein (MASP) [Trypanosoma cruzi]
MAMMMTGRVLLVCALCVLWCGAVFGHAMEDYCGEGGGNGLRHTSNGGDDGVSLKADCGLLSTRMTLTKAVEAADAGEEMNVTTSFRKHLSYHHLINWAIMRMALERLVQKEIVSQVNQKRQQHHRRILEDQVQEDSRENQKCWIQLLGEKQVIRRIATTVRQLRPNFKLSINHLLPLLHLAALAFRTLKNTNWRILQTVMNPPMIHRKMTKGIVLANPTVVKRRRKSR